MAARADSIEAPKDLGPPIFGAFFVCYQVNL